MITAQLHTEAASNSSSTPFTTGSAFRNSLTIERDATGSFTIDLSCSFLEGNVEIRCLKREECGAAAALESLGEPGEESAAQTELRVADADPRAVAGLVDLVEQVEDVEAQLEALVDPGLDRLNNAEIHLLIAGEAVPVRDPTRVGGPETAADGKVDGEAGVGRRQSILYPSRVRVGLVVIEMDIMTGDVGELVRVEVELRRCNVLSLSL